MSIRKCSWAGVTLVALFVPFAIGLVQADSLQSTTDVQTVSPGTTTEPLINPGKGWTMFGNAKRQPPEVLKFCSLGYVRYQWSSIEPEEGKYRWDIIERDMKSWTDRGCMFAFGILGASSHSKSFWVTPKWVFDAGAQYDSFELNDPKRPTTGVPGKKLVPLFDDPVYVAKLRNLINAVAEHFDGNPDLAFIDIRSYGNWGEGHMYPFRKHNITPEKYLEHLKIHRDAFKKTLLAIPGGNRAFADLYLWSVEHGITIRRDGICGNSNGKETAICENKTPSIFEFYGSYPFLKKIGWWDGIQDKSKCGYKLTDCVETGKPTWCTLSGGGDTSLAMLRDEPELIAKLTNRIGYYLILSKATWPKSIEGGDSFTVSADWENRGVAYMFVPAAVHYALVDQEGKIVQTCVAKQSKPREWKPDTPVSIIDSLRFDSVRPGHYTLAVGLIRENKSQPDIKLGIDLPVSNGWYKLGPITIR